MYIFNVFFYEENFSRFRFKIVNREETLFPYSSQRLGAPMAVSSSPEEATSALACTHLLLRRVELRGCEFLGSRLVGYNALLNLLVITSDSKNLPGSHDPVVKSVNHVENVPAAKTHLALLRLLVVEVSSARISIKKTEEIKIQEKIARFNLFFFPIKIRNFTLCGRSRLCRTRLSGRTPDADVAR